MKVDLKKSLWSAQGELALEVRFEMQPGELVGIYGASGAGKTSILRMLAGLMEPEEGVISLDGVDWFDSEQGLSLKPQKRAVGLLFQDYALFPNMTVRQNLEFALARGADPKR